MTRKDDQEILPIELERLLTEVDILRSAGWRLIQVLCVSSTEGWELSYSFGLDLSMLSLRFRVGPSDDVPSVTALYPAAFLYENEIRDLFGLRIERIRGDWQGKTYDVAAAPGGGKPFSKVSIVGPRSEGGAV
jgi:ech hydrogenase subunit D